MDEGSFLGGEAAKIMSTGPNDLTPLVKENSLTEKEMDIALHAFSGFRPNRNRNPVILFVCFVCYLGFGIFTREYLFTWMYNAVTFAQSTIAVIETCVFVGFRFLVAITLRECNSN